MTSIQHFAAERARGRAGRLLALAALLAGLSILISSQPASGQVPREFFEITVTTSAEEIREAVEARTSKPADSPRESELFRTISGPIQLKLSLGATPDVSSTNFFPISQIRVTNGSVSSLETPNGEDFTEWTVILTPSRSGTVRVSMVQSAIVFNVSGSNARWHNSAWSREFRHNPGPPTPVWLGFTSQNTFTIAGNNPTHGTVLIEDQHIWLALIYSEIVVVAGGTPVISFEIDGNQSNGTYREGSGTQVLRFRYTVVRDDPRNAILFIRPDITKFMGGITLKDRSDNEHALEDLPPVIDRVAELSTLPVKGASDPGRMTGDVVRWHVDFSDEVDVTDSGSKPFLVFKVTKPDGNDEHVRATYQSQVDSDTLLFSYTIPANTVASDSAFTLHNRHLVIPGGGFDIFGSDIHKGVVNTQLPATDEIYVADVQLREGESAVYPVARKGGRYSNAVLTLRSSSRSKLSVSPEMITFSGSSADVTLTAAQDGDGDDAAATVNGFYDRFSDLLHALWTVTVQDDDPEISALTAPTGELNAGDAVEFRITTASAPVSGREVTATITEVGPEDAGGDGCIDLDALTDVDPQTAGIQIHAPISDTAGGAAPLSVPTKAEDAPFGECMVTASLTAPTDANDERFFLISDSAALTNGALTASATVIGPEPGSEPLTTDFPPPGFALQLSIDDSDAVVTPGGMFNVVPSLTYTGGRYSPPLEVSGGRLWLSGDDYFWEGGSGQRTLSFSGQPGRCNFRLVDEVSTWTCPFALDAGAAAVRIPSIADPGRFQISGRVTIQDRTYSSRLEVEVREQVDEVAEVTFEAAAQTEGEAAGEPYPTSILSGQSTKLQLRILNENKTASAPGSVAAINFHTNVGSLSASLGSGEPRDPKTEIECAAGGLTCQIPVNDLTLANVGSIILTVSHPGPGKLGVAQVRAAVVDTGGESFLTEPVAVTFLGGGETLTISEPRGGVYYQDTADEGAEQDDRDLLTLSVSATDAGGSRVDAPDGIRRWTIKGPNGRTASGFSVAWPKGGETPVLDASRNLQVEIDVDSSSPLPLGEYTLELQAGRLRAKQSFSVVSGAGSLTLSGPTAPLEVGETITITAELKDASGRAVTDGTSVAWASGSSSGEGVLIQLAADTATTNGRAAARFFVIGRGSAFVRAESGDAADVLTASTAGADASASEPAAAGHSQFIRGCNPSSWLGAPISASNLYPLLENPSTLYYWTPSGWVRYGRHYAPGSPTHGRLIPGSLDFRIPTGGVISIIFAIETPCPFLPPGR